MKQKKKNLQKDILFIFISSFIVVVAWIAFNLYHIWATSSVSQDVQLQLIPINPQFDSRTMQQLTTRENIQPQFEIQKSITTITPAPPKQNTTLTPTPLVSGSPEATTQSETTASNASQLAPSYSPINRVGQ